VISLCPCLFYRKNIAIHPLDDDEPECSVSRTKEPSVEDRGRGIIRNSFLLVLLKSMRCVLIVQTPDAVHQFGAVSVGITISRVVD